MSYTSTRGLKYTDGCYRNIFIYVPQSVNKIKYHYAQVGTLSHVRHTDILDCDTAVEPCVKCRVGFVACTVVK